MKFLFHSLFMNAQVVPSRINKTLIRPHLFPLTRVISSWHVFTEVFSKRIWHLLAISRYFRIRSSDVRLLLLPFLLVSAVWIILYISDSRDEETINRNYMAKTEWSKIPKWKMWLNSLEMIEGVLRRGGLVGKSKRAFEMENLGEIFSEGYRTIELFKIIFLKLS